MHTALMHFKYTTKKEKGETKKHFKVTLKKMAGDGTPAQQFKKERIWWDGQTAPFALLMKTGNC